MCGIAGFVDTTGGRDRATLEALGCDMAGALVHRGPDDWGVWSDPSCGLVLAHRRLSILDLSAAGHQPMGSSDQRFVIVYNGEIYNFRSIRARLEALGHRFNGHSDTEVLVEACSAWGFIEAIRTLNGMFAIALYDRTRRTLHFARDRLGEKPLYYGWLGRCFAFASELGALRRHPEFAAAIDPAAAALYFDRNFVSGPQSIYRGIKRLPPGAHFSVDVTEIATDPVTGRYWSVPDVIQAGRSQPIAGNWPDVVEQVGQSLDRAVAMRLESDVPVGALLSGGIDSSLVVAYMQRHSSRPVRTFCVGFADPEYNEAEHAKRVAAHLGTIHTELEASPQDALSLVEALPRIYDEPFADCSQLATHLIARLAREHVTVALTGDGGDEAFAGYNRYLWGDRLWRRFGAWPPRLRRWLFKGLTRLSPATIDGLCRALRPLVPASLRFSAPGDRIHKLAAVAGSSSREALYGALLGNLSGHRGPGVIELEGHLADRDATFIEWMMAQDMTGYLPDDILVKVDRATMAVSLESRAPFLDHELVELSWRLPLQFKLDAGVGKRVTRELLYRHVPPELVDRPKTGFAVPIDTWLRNELRDWAEDLLAPVQLSGSGLLDVDHVRSRWREHLSGQRNWSEFLWSVLMFEAWRRGGMAGRPAYHSYSGPSM